MSHKSKELIHVTALAAPVANGTIRTWGNSLALRIPSEVSKILKLGDGVGMDFFVSDNDTIIIRARRFPDANDQEGLRALYLSMIAQVTSDMEGYEDEDALWEPMGDELEI